ncbi:MAG: TraX protein [Clostridia bacterium]|nr:TraX protein [Clostridia bacterium]
MRQESLVPERVRILSGSWLKLFAVITMLIDHAAHFLLEDSDLVLFSLGSRSIRLYTLMRAVGRSAFPLFCFLLVEGFLHTRDRRKYGGRLLLFCLLSELPWNLVHNGTLLYARQNVFFTLFLGFLGMCTAEAFLEEPERKKRIGLAGILFGLLAAAVLLRADYGAGGFGFILLLYFLREAPLFRAVTGCCLLSSGWKVFPAFAAIALYNGKRGFIKGRAVSLLFYAVYPLHLLVLYWIRSRTVGF